MTVDKMSDGRREVFLYLLFGGFTVLVSWASYAVFVWFGLELNVSNILSWICAVSFAFVVNKWFVFENRSTEKRTVMRELGSFFGARVLTGIIAITLFPILLHFGMDGELFGTAGLQARIVTSLVEIVLNWVFSKYLIFTEKRQKDPEQ